LTAVSSAVATAKYVSHSRNKTLQQYHQDLENMMLSEPEPVTSTNNVSLILFDVLTSVDIN
jgi:hypothetical protein